MSVPQTLNAYLAAFNEELEVGLRSRRRIFCEVTEHLRQAAEEEVRRGASPREAERRATAAFGAPEEVAARFEAGLTGWLDRRLALSIRWLHRFATERPMGPVFAVAGLGTFLAVAVAVVAASFGRNMVAAAGGFVAMATVVALFWGWPSRRRDLREMLGRRSAAPSMLVMLLAYPAVTGCVVLLAGAEAATSPHTILTVLLTYTSWFVIQWTSEAVVERAARRRSGANEAERRLDWRAEHPSRAALADVAPLPFALLALVAAYPGPGGLRVALAGLLATIGILAVVLVRLEHGRREKADYRTFYDRYGPSAIWTQPHRGTPTFDRSRRRWPE